jgi:uncharacterized membrane protein YoaT (DUF817 family)
MSTKPMIQLLYFGYHQAMSCIFPVAIFGTLALSNYINSSIFYRYDVILLILIAVQVGLLSIDWTQKERLN